MYTYQHGGNAVFEPSSRRILDLSANINPLGFPEKATQAIREEIPFCSRYPDSHATALREKIAEHEGIQPEWIFCGNGASDIIFRLPVALRAGNALLCAPSFVDYERALVSFGTNIAWHTLTRESGFDADQNLLQAADSQALDLIFLCNPNNPTGVMTRRELIEELLRCCRKKNTALVVDECFIDFVQEAQNYTAVPLLAQYDNLVVLKAFTKVFAMPGIRLGYAMSANQALIQKLYAHGPDWAVSNLAQAAGAAALEDARAYIDKTVSYVSGEREKMRIAIGKMGFDVFDSRANYLFFYSPFELDLYDALNQEGIRIRSCSGYKGLASGFYRTAVSNSGENQRLITAMQKIIREM